ncbi:MAG TPA: PxKF domain-containing protein, partial [Blastocatellia bacterium]|nr:PxKF domain-containing protein [Blastocatellia bacterium]
HGHCAVPANQQAAINDFWKKFLLGQTINWNVHVSPSTPAFTNLDYQRWTWWWGSGNPRFPDDPDTTPPSITVEAPSDHATYLLNAAVAANYSCSDSDSGVASCAGPVPSGSNINTATAGIHQFTVHAADAAGNTSAKTVTYTVQYAFNFVNLLPMPAQNTATAGSTVVIRYQLRDANGTNVSDLNSFIALNSFPTSCVTLVPTGEAEQVNSTGSGLRYDNATGQFIFNWKTDKSWSNSCRVLELTLADGTKQDVLMQFR